MAEPTTTHQPSAAPEREPSPAQAPAATAAPTQDPSAAHEPAQPPMQDQGPIQDQGEISIDTESTYSEDDLSTYTASLTSSVLNFPTENGRRYHAFRQGTYLFPNDEAEQDRMDLHHEMCMRACNGKLHLAPLTDTKDKRFLDLGTGTGIWCVEMGDCYPEAEIIGNDFSPMQPTMVPKNVKFEVDDIESPWTHNQKFDYIHSRFLAGGIADWPKLVEQCYENLNPGGIIELQDADCLAYSEDGTTKGTWLEKWNIDFMNAAKTSGRTLQPGPQLESWVRAAGFEDVHHEKIRVPLGTWPKDKKMKEVGAFNLVQLKEGLEGFSLVLFTRVLGWSLDEVQILLSKVRKDLSDKNVHPQNDMHVVWGRKPLSA